MDNDRPCLPGGPDGTSCIAGLLFGVGCCADGTCALCTGVTARMRRDGFSEGRISERLVATWFTPLDRCPRCGCPAPRLDEIPALPRFLRRYGNGHMSATCFVCGGALATGKRRFCSPACHIEFRRNVEGWGYGKFEPVPRVYKVH